ncbi:MAG: lamin tail domain-containing protein [Myxococcota bacterium]
MMKGAYQLVVAEGCDTYGLGESFAANKDKPQMKDLDVITTTNFSNASSPATVQDVLSALMGDKGTAAPTKWSELLSKMDNESSWFTTMYGVHGLDDAPHVHPWADLTKSCKACTTNASCGDGMQCVKMADGKSACAAQCTSTLGCGAGYECRNVATGSYLTAQVCAPAALKCGVPAPTAVGKPIISEILAAPGGDYNADGTQNASGDEYVEIVNAGAAPANLTGWSISDAVGVRHVFGNGSTIPPGGALVVFGGGSPALVAGTTIVQKASSGQLGLNDGGDTVTLSDIDGRQVARIVYASGIAKGKSWQRANALDESSAFSAAPATPGTPPSGGNF